MAGVWKKAKNEMYNAVAYVKFHLLPLIDKTKIFLAWMLLCVI